MFDFYAILSKNTDKVTGVSIKDKPGREFLEGISYSEFELSGKNYILYGLEHSNNRGNNYLKEGNITIAILGDIYLSEEHKADNPVSAEGKLSPQHLLRLYQSYGSGCIKQVKGSFILLIFDEESQEYFVFQSRLGLYFIYYQQDEDHLVISTSLKNIQRCSPKQSEINPLAILHYKVFDYPLDDVTLLKGSYNLEPCHYLAYDLKGVTTTAYFDYRQVIKDEGKISWENLYESIPGTFNNAVEQLTLDYPKVCSAITSGFDSRTIMSKLLNQQNDVLYYSWGIKDSFEVNIPKAICQQLKVNYKPIFLDDQFVESYDYFAKQAVYWSDALGTTSRANHTYGYSKLSAFSNYFITGILGSELLKPRNCKGYLYTDSFLELLYTKTKEDRTRILEKIIAGELENGFLDRELVQQCKDEFIQHAIKYFEQLCTDTEAYRNLYYFFLTEGFRKFFGSEIHGCRIYGTIVTPYGDDDFIKLLLSSPIPGLNNYAFTGNIKSSRKGSLSYLPIIEHNYDPLMDIKTGRHFTPRDLKSRFFVFRMILPYLKKKYYRYKKRNLVFDTPRWFREVLKKNESLLAKHDPYFGRNGSLPLSQADMQKKASLKLWIQDFTDS
jgi:hypothetical protein